MYKRILVPLDGSPVGKAGFNEAVKLARDQAAELCLLHVLDNAPVIQSVGVHPAGIEQILEAAKVAGTKLLAKAEAQAQKYSIPVRTILFETNAQEIASVIAGQAKKCRADLIVVGTHGRQGMSRLLLGSDAESVAREATVPVLLVRAKTSS